MKSSILTKDEVIKILFDKIKEELEIECDFKFNTGITFYHSIFVSVNRYDYSLDVRNFVINKFSEYRFKLIDTLKFSNFNNFYFELKCD